MLIEGFRHKGLQRLYLKGDGKAVPPAMLDKVSKLLLAIDTADSLDQLGYFPGWRLHPLKGDLKGYWSLTVTGNWRLIFEYDAATNSAASLDLIDYHGK